MCGCINDFRGTFSADVIRIDWTFLGSIWCEQRLSGRDAHTDELLVLLVKDPMVLLLRPNDLRSC